jgi:ABC-type lipoprotein export system ATPase subunit
MIASLIEVRELTKVYPMGEERVRALDGVSFDIQAGEFVALMGASGSGKSTLLHLLGCLDTPTSGSYRLAGQEVHSLSERQRAQVRNTSLGFIFQTFNLLSNYTALENVRLPLVYRGLSSGTWELARQALEQVGLSERLGHRPSELSGGQRQRVAIARALVADPPVLLADEPTGNLDSATGAGILALLHSLWQAGRTIVLVTHDSGVAARAGRVCRMKDVWLGKCLQKGCVMKPNELFLAALRGVLANKLRAVLTTLGVIIGVAAVIAMLAIGNGARAAVEASFRSLGSDTIQIEARQVVEDGVSVYAGQILSYEDG